MATALLVMAIVGTGVQAYGQYQQGKQAQAASKQAQAQAKAQAAWNLYNSKVAKRQAEAESRAAAFESKQAKRKAEALQAKFRARRGASGVGMEGSPLLAEEDLAAQLAIEQTNIRLTGQRRVAAYKSQSILDVSKASAATSRASGYGQAASTQGRAAYIGAGGTLLQGGAQAGKMGYDMGLLDKNAPNYLFRKK